MLAHGRLARVLAPLALAGGIATELAVLHVSPSDGLGWLPLVLIIGGTGLALALATGRLPLRAHRAALATALGLLLIAPAVWSVQTLGHATSGTFPAGGPASADLGGGGPGGGGPGGRPSGVGPNARPGVRFAGGLPGGPPPIGAQGRSLGPPSGAGAPAGGAPGGGNERQVTQALSYIRTHGGGTLGVASQQGAAGSILASGAHIAGLGGFSGRESRVSISWLANAVGSGRLRWVLSEGRSGAGLPGDTRVGARTALAAVAQVCTRVTTTSTAGAAASANGATTTTGAATASIGALYDCQGKASALAKLT